MITQSLPNNNKPYFKSMRVENRSLTFYDDLQMKLISPTADVTEDELWAAIKSGRDGLGLAVAQHKKTTFAMLEAMVKQDHYTVAVVGILENPLATRDLAQQIWDSNRCASLHCKNAVLDSRFADIPFLWAGLILGAYTETSTFQGFTTAMTMQKTVCDKLAQRSSPDNMFIKELLVYGLQLNGVKEANTSLPFSWLQELVNSTIGNILTN